MNGSLFTTPTNLIQPLINLDLAEADRLQVGGFNRKLKIKCENYLMVDKKITCFIPCRAGSQRVPRKNITAIGDFEYGLLQIKLSQVLSCEKINEVILSTNDKEILDFGYKLQKRNDKLFIDERAEELCLSETSTDQVIDYVPKLIGDGHVLWTHVTSPFLTTSSYDAIISKFQSLGSDFDSLMTVNKIQNFLWDQKQPINYDRLIEKWPRTQTLNPIYEINSGAFIADIDDYTLIKDRIGRNPYLHVVDKFESLDVDWPEDFRFVSKLIECRVLDV